jgi:hypothetical protein
MKAFEFMAQVNPDGTLPVPAGIAQQLQREKPVRVIVLTPDEDSEEAAWNRFVAEQFLKGYADSDAIYDNL